MPESAKDEIVRLTSAGSLQEAALWKSALEQEGVRCEYGLGFHSFYPELMVHREDAERVRIILRAYLKKK
jgi:hypothetical protein